MPWACAWCFANTVPSTCVSCTGGKAENGMQAKPTMLLRLQRRHMQSHRCVTSKVFPQEGLYILLPMLVQPLVVAGPAQPSRYFGKHPVRYLVPR